jgi:hypothetical protein
MAGSKKWFEYTTDTSDIFAISLDESNTEAVNGAEGDYDGDSTAIYALPRNVSPRYAVYANSDRTRVIRCCVLTQAAFNTVQTNTPTITDPIAGTGNLSLIRKEPERIRLLPIAEDTGLTDGDPT